jgi:hypothetical protein
MKRAHFYLWDEIEQFIWIAIVSLLLILEFWSHVGTRIVVLLLFESVESFYLIKVKTTNNEFKQIFLFILPNFYICRFHYQSTTLVEYVIVVYQIPGYFFSNCNMHRDKNRILLFR